jgi:hypothetical protein
MHPAVRHTYRVYFTVDFTLYFRCIFSVRLSAEFSNFPESLSFRYIFAVF